MTRTHVRSLVAALAAALLLPGSLALADEPPVADAVGETDDDGPTEAPPPRVQRRKVEVPVRPPSKLKDTPKHESGSPPPPSVTGTGFAFGSYGRVGLGIDGRGHQGHGTNVVSRGSRLEAPPYIEMNFYYGGQIGSDPDARWRVVLAPAFGGDLFHYNGSFASRFAVRNAYAEVQDLGIRGLNIWAGSRMLRGDDIYLFDYWPLDNLNTVGAGANLKVLGALDLQLHAGLNRLNDPYFFQTEQRPAAGVGPATTAYTLDRPRSVVSLKGTYYIGPLATWGAKVSLYGEFHYLPEGQRKFVNQMRSETLPADWGLVAGVQLGGWLRSYTFANLFFRYARGLGVYGDLSSPYATGNDRSSAEAQEFVVALSANYEMKRLGIMAGGFFRSYTDPAPINYNPSNYVEGIVGVRPQIYLTEHFHIAAELSYQQRGYGGYDQIQMRRLSPWVARASVMPIVSPMGRGTYSRPMIYLVATYSRLSDDAVVSMFDPADVRYGKSDVLYLGLGAEWWFQSSYR